MKKIQEDKDNKDNIIDLKERRLALASKEPPSGGNWLSSLPSGTRFLASMKNVNSSRLVDFLVATDPTKMTAVLLGIDLGGKAGSFEWHDPVRFSKSYEYFMTIETEKENGSTQIQSGRMEGDGQPEIVDPVHESE